MTAMFVVLLLVGGVILALAWAFQRTLIYFPFGSAGAPADVGLDATESIGFMTDDGIRLGGWFVASRTSPSRGTIIVFNGNAGNRAFRAELARALRDRGMAVLLFDYRGFGGNPGRPTEDGLARDASAARAFLETRADVDPRRVFYFGESLGAAVAVRLAVERPPAALVLRSPFTSLADVGQVHYPILPVHWLLRRPVRQPDPHTGPALPRSGHCRRSRPRRAYQPEPSHSRRGSRIEVSGRCRRGRSQRRAAGPRSPGR